MTLSVLGLFVAVSFRGGGERRVGEGGGFTWVLCSVGKGFVVTHGPLSLSRACSINTDVYKLQGKLFCTRCLFSTLFRLVRGDGRGVTTTQRNNELITPNEWSGVEK